MTIIDPSTTPLSTASPIVVTAADTEYETARRAWNLHADQRPAAVAAATSVAEVQAALAYARRNHLRVAAQTTGHLAAALPALDDTLLLKPVLHDGTVEIDPVARRARVLSGARWRDVVDAAAAHGLTAMHGSSPTVGVVGYLLGGGLSFYARQHGLAVDHVHAFEIVTADGRLRRVTAECEPDLFWALRGGGGVFGVVTAVEIDLLPYGEVFAGAHFFEARHARALTRAWWAWARTAPRSVTTALRILRLPQIEEVPPPLRGIPVVCVDGVALCDTDGEGLVALLTGVAEPMLGGWGRMPACAVATLHGDPEDPTAAIVDGAILEGFDDEAIDAFIATVGEDAETSLGIAELRQLGGALAEPAPGGGVRNGIAGDVMLAAIAPVMSPSMVAAAEVDVRGLRSAMAPWTGSTRFLSFAEEGATLSDCVPPAALDRLRAVHRTVDPDRLFVAPHELV